MKIYISLIFLFVVCRLFSQNLGVSDTKDSADISSVLNYEIVVENYNYWDTTSNKFANYYIKNSFDRYNLRIEELKEAPLISGTKNEQYLFRVLSLPSFDHPVCFTIENKNDQLFLNWTVGRGTGGYEPKGIKKKGNMKLLKKEWEYFKQLINIAQIDSLPLASYLSMTDGTSWVIEKNIDNKYKIHFSNILPQGIEDGYLFLLHLSGVKNEDVTYYDGRSVIRIFDKNNHLIDLLQIEEKIVTRLNQKFHDSKDVKEFCLDCGFFIKISSRGKVKSLKYSPYMLPFQSFQERWEYFTDNYIDRKYRHKVKQSLSDLEFEDLNLAKRIWVPVNIKYNTENQLLEVDD